jgi:histidyl-tRNA synthetase
MAKFEAPKGTLDILPGGSKVPSELYQHVVRTGEDLFQRYGYRLIVTPVFEDTDLFQRSLVETSEIVNKEMYSFTDRSGRSLTLRPEGTAPVLRAVLEHNLHKAGLPLKLFYTASSFRYEQPQSGRYRAFNQLGVEAIGSDEPVLDAEVIELASRLYEALGLQPELLLNSTGHPGCRGEYLPKLVEFLRAHFDELDEDCRRRTETNPLRTFDCKVPRDQEILADAPLITDYLCGSCADHFEAVQDILTSVGIKFQLNPRLVRGLDYYTRTTFTFVSSGLGAQDEVGGGGRYDGLSELLGGDPLPGIGFGLGIERIVLALQSEGIEFPSSIDVYVVSVGEEFRRKVFEIATGLRSAGWKTDFDQEGRALKRQLKVADKAGARFAVIVGEKELAAGKYTVRDMTSGEEVPVAQEQLTDFLRR